MPLADVDNPRDFYSFKSLLESVMFLNIFIIGTNIIKRVLGVRHFEAACVGSNGAWCINTGM